MAEIEGQQRLKSQFEKYKYKILLLSLNDIFDN
jgi:hypothetical protein